MKNKTVVFYSILLRKGSDKLFLTILCILMTVDFAWAVAEKGSLEIVSPEQKDSIARIKSGIRHGISQIRVPFVFHKDTQSHTIFSAQTFWGTATINRKGEIGYFIPGCRTSEEESPKFIDSRTCSSTGSTFLSESLVGGEVKEIHGRNISSTKVNFVKKDGVIQPLSAYEQVQFVSVYPGIELNLQASGGNVEKIFKVSPEGNPDNIRLQMTGGRKLEINDQGELKIEVATGQVIFSRPVAYQEIAGQRREITVAYRLDGKNDYGFSLGNYDKTRDLIIDPVLEQSGTGGAGVSYANGLAVDAQGNVYIAGTTYSASLLAYPIPYTGYDTTFNGGYARSDSYVMKFDPDLTMPQVVTYFGGSHDDSINDLTLDAQGNVYVVGHTASSDLPITATAYDRSHNGSDVFVAKFTPDLETLLASTFLGGTSYDSGSAIVVEEFSGDVIIAGMVGSIGYAGKSASTDFPTTLEAFDRTFSGTCRSLFRKTVCPTAAFISRFDSNLSQLKASTFLDGTGSEAANALAIGIDGDIYVTGNTTSSNFPVTVGTYDATYNGGAGGYSGNLIDPRGDAFIARLDPMLSTLKASTLLGGSGTEKGITIDLDRFGDVVVGGGTDSNNFPTTPGAFQTVATGSNVNTIARKDGFLAKLDENLTTLKAATYIGGVGSDSVHALLIRDSSSVLVGGGTDSGDFFAPFKTYSSYPFLVHLNSDSLSLIEGEVLTSVPGNIGNAINQLRVGIDGTHYAAGSTSGIAGVYSGGWVAKLGSVDLAVSISHAPDPVAVGENLIYSIGITNNGPYRAKNVNVSFSMPDLTHFTFVSAISSQGNCSFTGTSLGCSLETLESNANATIQVTVIPIQGGMLIMGAQVKANEPDRDLTNNSASTSAIVTDGNQGGGGNGGAPGTVDLVVTAVDSPDPAPINALVTYNLTVVNQGTAQASGVVLTQTFQNSIILNSIQSSQGSCSFSAQMVTCNLGNLAPGISVNAQVIVQYIGDGGMTTFVETTAQEIDSDPDTNQIEVGTEILAN